MSNKTSNETFEYLKTNTSYSVTRIGALYKDFQSSKQLNPEGYEANLISWYTIFKALLTHDFFIDTKLSIPHKNPLLEEMLTLPVIGKPLSLDLVIDELLAKRLIIPVSTYLNYDSNFNTYISPQTSMLTYLSPYHWINEASNLGNQVIRRFIPTSERYIIWTSLCEFGKIFMDHLNGYMNDGIYSSQLFDEQLLLQFIYKHITTNFLSLDLKILLKYLTRDTQDCYTKPTKHQVTVIKFNKDSDITDEDIDIIHIKTNMNEVTKRMENIESKIQALSKRISIYSVEKIRKDETIKTSVMNLLSQKKHLINVYKQSSSIYTQLNEVLSKIDSVSSNVKIFNVLKQSSQTLKVLNSQVNLDDIDQVNSEIRDQIDIADQTTEALGNNTSYEDIEEEFNDLLEQQQKQQETDQHLLNKLEQLNVDNGTPEAQPKAELEAQPNEQPKAEPENNSSKKVKPQELPLTS